MLHIELVNVSNGLLKLEFLFYLFDRTDGRSDGRTDGRMDGRPDGRTGGRKDGRRDGGTDLQHVGDQGSEFCPSTGCPLNFLNVEARHTPGLATR